MLAAPASGESLRVATYNADLSRKGPGLLLKDIADNADPQVSAVVQVIVAAHPDVLFIAELDWDGRNEALSAMQAALAKAGAPFAYAFAFRPNTGMRTGIDLDGDGKIRLPTDAQGWGLFPGQRGMAILSRLPVDANAARDFSGMLWRDLPGNLMEGAGLSAEAAEIQRLSTTGHWDVPVILPDGRALHLLTYYATPPVFDGPEDRNGRRNHDETAFWLRYLDGALPWPAPDAPFVILGDADLDPLDGDGRPEALRALLADPRVSDLMPKSEGGAAAAMAGKRGDPALDTADWRELKKVGDNLRVDYVLPSADLRVTGSGVYWPPPGTADADLAATASRHRLVWVDIDLP